MQGNDPKEKVSAWQSELGDCPLKCCMSLDLPSVTSGYFVLEEGNVSAKPEGTCWKVF